MSTPGARTPSLPEVHGSIPLAAAQSWWRRFLAFAGPGYLVSVGYMDPGNWATDLAGGAKFGYALIWVILLSNLMAMFLQTLCVQARRRHRTRPGAGLPRAVLAAGRASSSGSSARSRSSPATWPR